MSEPELNFSIETLGECRIPSPMTSTRFVSNEERLLFHSRAEDIRPFFSNGAEPPSLEVAGPREKIFFDPSKLKCGIVTCGGLCPGVNDVIRAIVLGLIYHYGVKNVFGFPYGYEGLSSKYSHSPVQLTFEMVARIHGTGGTILSSSRGPQDPVDMVDTLDRMNIGILFAIGGDGTLRGVSAICDEIKKRGLKIAVVGIPKTIDNDISYVQKSFGFETAVSEARRVIAAAHCEATGARNGIGLVKLMGRESGFIAAFASLASADVNYCLVPEVPFSVEGLLTEVEERIRSRGHAVIVVSEGAGQELICPSGERDASGNVKFGDIGVLLRDHIRGHFKKANLELNLKYIDPSYTIRSLPANPSDSAFCLLLGYNAVHAAMTGRTNMLVGFWNHGFTYLPIPLAVFKRKKIVPSDWLWRSVLSATGQPALMC